NPITTIQFQVPVCHSGVGRNPVVTIKVFDLLGREVKTLVNEYKQPGTYQVSFNADGLSSGVYFYSMKAGDFVAIGL
ncbi:T9SS type A sorting domain-containing protein, partial [Citrobacter sp. AAK_AS5]